MESIAMVDDVEDQLDDLPMVGKKTIFEISSREATLEELLGFVNVSTGDLKKQLTRYANGESLSPGEAKNLNDRLNQMTGTGFGMEEYRGNYSTMYTAIALEGFSDFVKNTWDKIKKMFRSLVSFIRDAFARITSNLSLVKRAAEKIKDRASAANSKSPRNGQEIDILSNKYLFSNGKYDVKGPDNVLKFIVAMNENIPDKVHDLVKQLTKNLVDNNTHVDLKDLQRQTTAVITSGMRVASKTVTSSKSPIKRSGCEVYRSEVISNNKALYITVPMGNVSKEAEDQIKGFVKGFNLQVATVPDMGKPAKGLKTKIRNGNEIASAMGTVIRAIEAYKKADDVMKSIARDLELTVNKTLGKADDEKLPDERRRYIRTNLDALLACRKLLNANVVGSYALCASTLKAHVKQAKKELATFEK